MERPHSAGRFSEVRRVASTGSTNDDLMERGRQGDPEGMVLVADHQQAGRGRRDRAWTAPVGTGLLCSVLLRPPARVASLVTATVAVALTDALAGLGADQVGIKWPNDLVAQLPAAPGEHLAASTERKLAGILAEVEAPSGSSASSGQRVPGAHERLLVVAGCGVNVLTPDTVPAELVDRAVALDALVAPAPTVGEVLDAYLAALEAAYTRLLDQPGDILATWRQRCVTVGRDVRVDLGTRDLVGRAVDLDTEGRLVVRTPQGDDHHLAVGDVVHLDGGGRG